MPPSPSSIVRAGRRLAAPVMLAAAAGCAGGRTAAAPPATVLPAPAPSATAISARSASASPIEHIVFIIQENRSFDNVFHGFAEPDGTKADTVDLGYKHDGTPIALTSVAFEDVRGGPSHGHGDAEVDEDGGKNDGFDLSNSGLASINYGYAYLPRQEVQPYWDLASQGALAQRFFHGIKGSTYPSHLELTGATTVSIVGSPQVQLGWGCEDANPADHTSAVDANDVPHDGPFPCVDQLSIFDLLERAGHTWRYYSGPVGVTPGGNLNAAAYYRHIYYGKSFAANVRSPETTFLTDVSGPAGTLADVTYIVPEGENSDAAQGGTSTGPQWVADVVNAIGASPFYASTAVFITWDDWGGWYDHVPSPAMPGNAYNLGLRIPLIAVSPYARHGKLIDTPYEGASVLRFMEETFGLGTLGARDRVATSVDGMFDFAQASPPPYAPVTSSLGPEYFLTHPLDYSVADPE